MGYFVLGVCKSCGYHQEFRLGCGLADYKLQQIYSHFDLSEQKRIQDIILKNGYHMAIFNYKLGRCGDCGKVFEVPEITFDDGATYHSKRCECKKNIEHKIELFSENMQQVRGPNCGQMMEVTKKGIWD